MKMSRTRTVWAYLIAALLIATFATIAICADPAPSYLDTATYITSAKCKMCHKAEFTAWETTKHGQICKQQPATDAKPEAPSVETLYRRSTGFNPATKTAAEPGVGCEACHGPGSAHMKAKKEERASTIVDPGKLKTAGQKVSLCGRCHGQYTIDGQPVALMYKFGQDLLTTEGFKMSAIEPGKAMQEMNEVVASKHFKAGVTCIDCHTSHTAGAQAHSLKKPQSELCVSCHKDITLAKHAPTAAADATCGSCHMPKGSHTFAKPE